MEPNFDSRSKQVPSSETRKNLLKNKGFSVCNILKNEATRKSIIYGYSDVLRGLLGIALILLYAHTLSIAQVGIINLLTAFILVGQAVLQLGYCAGVGRHFFYVEKEEQAALVWSPAIIMLVASVPVLVLLYFQAGTFAPLIHSELAIDTLRLAILILPFNMLFSYCSSLLLYREDFKRIVYLHSLRLVVWFGLVCLILVNLQWSLNGVFLAWLGCSMITSLWAARHTLFRYPFCIRLVSIGHISRFSFLALAVFICYWIIDYLDLYLLKRFVPLAEIGLYGTGYQIGMMSNIIITGFVNTWPILYYKNDRNRPAQELVNYAMSSVMLPGSFMAILICILSPVVLKVCFPVQYLEAYPIIPVIALAYLFRGPLNIFLTGLHVKNRNDIELAMLILAGAVNVATNLVLIPVWGKMGAAVSTLVSFLFLCFLAYFAVQRINPIPRFSWSSCLFSFGMVGTVGAVSLLVDFNNNLWTAIFCLGALLVSALTYYRPLAAILKSILPFEIKA